MELLFFCLPAGIIAVNGSFRRGDTVAVTNEAGRELARGIVAYGSEDLLKLVGCHSDAIETRLGYTYGPSVVHRNHMTLLAE